jgi:hypothetical protein
MRGVFDYLRDRIAEPGTQRSLALVLFAVLGGGNSTEAWEAGIYLLIAFLGTRSALMVEPGPAPGTATIAPPEPPK